MAFLREVGLEHEWQRVDRVASGVEELGGAVRDHRQRRSTPCVDRDRSSATEGVPEREAAGCHRREHLLVSIGWWVSESRVWKCKVPRLFGRGDNRSK